MRKHLFKILAVLFIIGFFAAGGLFLWAATLTIPDLHALEQRTVAQSTKIYDKTGEVLLYDLHENIQRTIVPYDKISRNIKNATVAIEDNEFYEHPGIEMSAIMRSVLVNLLNMQFEQGGSTITQQVVKNTLLTNEKAISRKLKEWILALKLEQKLSKEQILALYLNESPYGGSMYGIQAASKQFFEKPASELTIAESAYLAALPKAPTYYSPYGNNRDELEERKNIVLREMRENNFISEAEYKDAKNAEVAFASRKPRAMKAPHFVTYIKQKLEEKYGQRAVQQRGFEVTTTLDYELQQKAQEVVKKHAQKNEEQFNAENAGVVAIDPKTGQIRAMVGSRNYFSDEIDGHFNIALAHRQPGSAFKPFVYAQALREGYTPETVVFDTHTQFSTACAHDNLTTAGECYAPRNYDSKFRGPVTFREALAQSINVPAVKVLYLAGLNDAFNLAKAMGLEHLENPGRYGLTLVLGGGEVSLLNITSAYGVFAAEGTKVDHTAIKKIEDGEGNVVASYTKRSEQVLKPRVARQISDMLADNEARAPAFGYNSPLHFPNYDVAAKTGTTDDYRDAWTVGYSPDIAIGAWAGNNDNTSMKKEIAGYIVTPMWNEIMQYALENRNTNNDFRAPQPKDTSDLKPVLRGIWRGGETYYIDTISGKLATQYTPEETKEEKVIPNVHSILYWVDKDNPRGPIPENPEKDPQFKRWEYPVRQWAKQHELIDTDTEKPDEKDDVHLPENAPEAEIIKPAPNSSHASDERILISLEASGEYDIQKADFYVNGTFVGADSNAPLQISFIPKDIGIESGQHTISATVYDTVYNKTHVDTEITIE